MQYWKIVLIGNYLEPKVLANSEEKTSLLISKGRKCEITRRYTRGYYSIDLQSTKTFKTHDIHKR